MAMSDGSAEELSGMAGSAPAPQDDLALLPLLNTVVFPLTVTPLAASHPESIALIEEALRASAPIGVVTLRQVAQRPPSIGLDDVYPVGTLALVHKLVRFPDGALRVALQGLERIAIAALLRAEPYLRVRATLLPDPDEDPQALAGQATTTGALAQQFAALLPHVPEELAQALQEQDPRVLAYQLASALYVPGEERQEILALPSIAARLERLAEILRREIRVLELGRQLRGNRGQAPASGSPGETSS